MKDLTQEALKESPEFKEMVTGRIVLIHNPYYDHKDNISNCFIVIHSKMGRYTITRFWRSPNLKQNSERIWKNNDYVDITAEEVFKVLLSDYSTGLK